MFWRTSAHSSSKEASSRPSLPEPTELSRASATDALKHLRSCANGLAQDEADRRLREYGLKTLEVANRISLSVGSGEAMRP
jgi:hypothetical protein